MKTKTLPVIVLGCALLFPSWTRAADKLEGIKLVWRPATTVAKGGGIDPVDGATNIVLSRLTDGRTDPDLIRENREDKRPKKVTTQDDVLAFETDQLKKLLSGVGLSTVDGGGAIVLSGELQKFFVDEKDDYIGRVQIKFTARNADEELWTGTVFWRFSHYGRAYKTENYSETLSDSLLDLAVNLFRDPAFRQTLATK